MKRTYWRNEMIWSPIIGSRSNGYVLCLNLITLLPVHQENGFPIKTFMINVIGSFIIGLVAALAARNAMSPKAVLFLKIGICGGFTTFSSFALETEGLLEKGSTGIAMLYVILSLVCDFFSYPSALYCFPSSA